jgi:AcrR family transcriptional regulator
MNERKTLKYSSPLRANQAAANRTGILRAAHDLFLAKGFGATTIDQIAEAAGVSKPTVFSAVGNKAEVLSAVRDVAMAGDDTPVPVAKRPSAARIAAAPDLSSAVKALSEHIGGVSKRAAGIQEVVRGAAASGDRAMQKLWDTVEEERRRGSMFLVGLVAEKASLSVPREKAIDILWLLMAPENYQRLVVQCGWSDEAYRKWPPTPS